MIITISRQYAAGGSDVAQRVAAAIGWTVVDDALIDRVSERSGFAPEEVASLEERVPSFLERLAQSSALSFPEYLVSTPEVLDEPQELKLARITRDVVAELGRRDRLIFVGRAVAAMLARDANSLHVRLVASREHRIRVAVERLGVPENQVSKLLDSTDRNRERYHDEYYARDWNDPVNYHMVLNTELLGTDGASAIVVAHARSLGW